jgi:dynein heavy chain, axonemal
MQQMQLIEIVNSNISRHFSEPSEMDLERYQYYIENGIHKNMIAKLPDNQFSMFCERISNKLRKPEFKNIMNNLSEDIKIDYEFAMQKSILDYVLLNENERQRLQIENIPKSFLTKYVNLIGYQKFIKSFF